MSVAAAGAAHRGEPRHPGHRRRGRHRWRLRGLLCRHRPTSPTPPARSRRTRSPPARRPGVEYTELQVATDALTVVVHPDLDGRLPDRRPARRAVGSRVQGHELERARPELPRRGDLAVRSPAPTRARTTTWPLTSSAPSPRRHPRRLRGVGGRQRPGPGRRWHRGCDRLLRLHLLRGEHRHPEGAVDRQRQRLHRAVGRDRSGWRVHALSPVRSSSTSTTPSTPTTRPSRRTSTSTSRTSPTSPRSVSSSR